MSGPTTPNGPSNVSSLARLDIVRAYDDHEIVFADTTAMLGADPLPARIARDYRANNAGVVLGNQLDPTHPDYGREFIPHQYVPRHPQNVTPYDKTIDTTVTIPALFVANPL